MQIQCLVKLDDIHVGEIVLYVDERTGVTNCEYIPQSQLHGLQPAELLRRILTLQTFPPDRLSDEKFAQVLSRLMAMCLLNAISPRSNSDF